MTKLIEAIEMWEYAHIYYCPKSDTVSFTREDRSCVVVPHQLLRDFMIEIGQHKKLQQGSSE